MTDRPPRLPELSPRLQAVAEMLRPCDHLYDIGTDHAFLPIHLVRQGICQRATASDIGSGPIAVALRNIDKAGLLDRIDTMVTFGLDGHPLGSGDALIMAGLGGLEMIDILSPEPRICQQILLQPQKSTMELRLWLAENQYLIDDEQLVLDRNRLYTVMSIHYAEDGHEQTRLTRTQATIGPVLLERQPALFAEHLRRLASHLRKASRSQPELHEVLETIERLQRSTHDDREDEK